MSETTLSERTAALARTFARCAEQSRAALVVYTTAGHPDPARGLETLLALADAGADVIELGIPFSDPLADGPTIQKASFDAIERGVTLRSTLELLARFRRERDTPVVIFSYLNPIFKHGVEDFLREAAEAGADGLLLTDLPAGADPELEEQVLRSRLDLVRLLAPTTRPERVARVAEGSQGFLYYVSRTGVTGAQTELAESLQEEVRALRARTDLPVAVGFGISTPEQAAAVAQVADGVVVGSALVEVLGREGIEAAGRFVRSLSAAMARG